MSRARAARAAAVMLLVAAGTAAADVPDGVQRAMELYRRASALSADASRNFV